MLDVRRPNKVANPAAEADSSEQIIDIRSVFGFLRRSKVAIIGFAALGVALGVGYLLVTPPVYTARTDILVDAPRLELFRDTSVFTPEGQITTGVIESNIAVITSDKVIGAVVDKLKLIDNPDFSAPSLLSQLRGLVGGLFSSDDGGGDKDRRQAAIGVLDKNLTVDRVGLSFVISVYYASTDAALAAQISNAVAEAYIQDQIDTRVLAAERASDWLSARITDLRARALQSDTEIQQFRVANNMIDVNTKSGGVRRISDQKVEDLTTQLTAAQSKIVDAQSRLDQLNRIIESKAAVIGIPESISNDIVNRLREEYLTVFKQEADWSKTYGPNHAQTINLRNRMVVLESAIRNELQRLAAIAQSDLQIAQAREQQTRQNLDSYVAQSNDVSRASIQLRELESAATANRSLYEAFLQRYMQAGEEQSLKTTEARIITPATPPQIKTSPKSILVLGASLFLGLGLGLGVSMLRELMDRMVRTTRQVEAITSVPCLGVLPRYTRSLTGSAGARTAANESARVTRSLYGVQSIVRDEPSSHFAEAVRSVKVAVDLAGISRETKVIGIVSSVEGEGKSTLALNLIQVMGMSGKRALLIDGDLRNPALTRELSPRAGNGVIEVLRGNISAAEAIWTTPDGTFDFLPAAVSSGPMLNSSDIVGSGAMKALLGSMRQAYDYVVVDFAPVLSSADARAAAVLMDAFVLVVGWGETGVDTLAETVNVGASFHDRILGAVLTKADLDAMRSFEHVPRTYY